MEGELQINSYKVLSYLHVSMRILDIKFKFRLGLKSYFLIWCNEYLFGNTFSILSLHSEIE